MKHPIVDRFVLGFRKGWSMYWNPVAAVFSEMRRLFHPEEDQQKRQHN